MQGWVDLGIGYIPKSRPIGSKVAMDSYSACRTEIASKSFRYDMRHTNNHHFTCHQRWATPVFTPQPQTITALWPVLIVPTQGWMVGWKFNVPRNTLQVISETVFPVNHLDGTSKTESNYNKIQLTTQKTWTIFKKNYKHTQKLNQMQAELTWMVV